MNYKKYSYLFSLLISIIVSLIIIKILMPQYYIEEGKVLKLSDFSKVNGEGIIQNDNIFRNENEDAYFCLDLGSNISQCNMIVLSFDKGVFADSNNGIHVVLSYSENEEFSTEKKIEKIMKADQDKITFEDNFDHCRYLKINVRLANYSPYKLNILSVYEKTLPQSIAPLLIFVLITVCVFLLIILSKANEYLYKFCGWIENKTKDVPMAELGFCITIIFTNIIFVIMLFVTRGRIYSDVFASDTTDTFNDFVNCVYDVYKMQPYQNGSIYPPLCHVIYAIFSKFIPSHLFENNWYHFPGALYIANNQSTMLVTFVYMTLSLLFVYIGIKILLEKYNQKNKIMPFCLLFSYPILFAFERGNIMLICLGFLLIFFGYWDSTVKWKKNLALLALSFAINIKIYPVIFLLLFLKKKRWKELVIVIMQCTVIFVLSMLCFGGVSGFCLFFKNLLINTGVHVRNGNFGYQVDFMNIIEYFSQAINNNVLGDMSRIIAVIICGLLVVAFYLSDKKWKEVLALSLIIVSGPSFSYVYNIGYLIIPVILYFRESKLCVQKSIYYWIMLSIFIVYPFGDKNILKNVVSNYPVNVYCLFAKIFILIMAVCIIISCFCEYGLRKRKKKLCKLFVEKIEKL